MDVGHSFIQIRKSCFFFFRGAGKKNTDLFFFISQEKLIGHSFGFLWSPLFLTVVGCIFFFRSFVCFLCVFFFPRKSSHVIHSFDLRVVFFFSGFGKNKKQYFHSFNRFFSKSAQKRTFPGKKKNTVPLVPAPKNYPNTST